MTSQVAALEPVTLEVKMATIRAYAELTDDFNPIHLDPEFAASTPMGGIIAHGTMSMCLLYQMLQRNLGAAAFAALDIDVRFLRPVREGEVLTAGGAAKADAAGTYDVWVRAGDGTDRLAGTVRVAEAA
jgi:3-hydroxybutyryl-CoA dehydratase